MTLTADTATRPIQEIRVGLSLICLIVTSRRLWIITKQRYYLPRNIYNKMYIMYIQQSF